MGLKHEQMVGPSVESIGPGGIQGCTRVEGGMSGLSVFSASSVSRATEALMGSQDPRVTKARRGKG